MKKISLLPLLFLFNIAFAQQEIETENDQEMSNFFMTYWPIIILPIFMVVIWGAYRRRKKNQK